MIWRRCRQLVLSEAFRANAYQCLEMNDQGG
jgi:hypothetical protein